MNDTRKLIESAAGPKYFWSRVPGQFVDKTTGRPHDGIGFTGTVREWYETLVETIIDVAMGLERDPGNIGCRECGIKKRSVNFCVVSPDVQTILECSVLYKPVYTIRSEKSPFSECASCGQASAQRVGSLYNRFTIYSDPKVPRDRILVGSIADDGTVVDDPGCLGIVTVTDMTRE